MPPSPTPSPTPPTTQPSATRNRLPLYELELFQKHVRWMVSVYNFETDPTLELSPKYAGSRAGGGAPTGPKTTICG